MNKRKKNKPTETISVVNFVCLFILNCIVLIASVIGCSKGKIDIIVAYIIITSSILCLIILCMEAADDEKCKKN